VAGVLTDPRVYLQQATALKPSNAARETVGAQDV
jgi:3-isopropylmalate/(R)-2-methylmalate dehydratase large subunit